MDRQEFESAVERYQDMVFRVALHALGSRADAEDAVQETFLRLFTCQKPFESEDHRRRWLLRVTVNGCKNALKSRRRRPVSLEEVGEVPVFDRPADGALYAAVMSLPPRYRVPLGLFYYEELSTGEIAQILGLRQSAVTTRLARGRAMLKQELKEDWRDDE